jgi:hypothetical protein
MFIFTRKEKIMTKSTKIFIFMPIRIIAVIVAIATVFFVLWTTGALAATPVYQETTFNNGDIITAIIYVDGVALAQDIEDCDWSTGILYDHNLLEYKDFETHSSTEKSEWNLQHATPAAAAYLSGKVVRSLSWSYGNDSKMAEFSDGDVAIVATFTALSNDILSEQVITGGYNNEPTIITVTSQTSATPYTITPSGVATAPVNSSFDVDVTLTADPLTSKFSSAQAELTYNPELVSPVLTGLNNVSSKEGVSDTLVVTLGPAADAEVGDGVKLASIPFTPASTAAGSTAEFTVSTGAFITLEDTSGAPISAASGTPLSVQITAAQAAISFDAEYEGLPTGYTLLQYQIPAAPTVTYEYSGNTMHYVYDVSAGKHYMTYIITATEANETTAALAAKISPTSESFNPTADANGDDAVNISDAQIAFDLANPSGYYETFANLSIAARLGADVNNDGQIDATDAEAVIYAIHHNGELPSVG